MPTSDLSQGNSLSPTNQLDFSWTLQMSDRFAKPSESISNSLNAMCTIWELLHRIVFASYWNLKLGIVKVFNVLLSKISLHYQTVIDQKLTVFHQLFSWTSVGPSKCPIDKMIGSQGHPRVWGYPRVQHYIIQRLFQR